MSINAQIVDQQVRKIVEDHITLFPDEIRNSGDEHKQRSAAFVLLCIQRLLDLPLDEALPCVTEGGQDHGIDGMYVGEVQNGSFPVYLFQGKYSQSLEGTSGFSQGGIIKLINAMCSIFDPDIEVSVNPALQVRIEEARSLVRDGNIPYVIACPCSNGKMWEQNGQDSIDEADLGGQVTWEYINHDRLIEIQTQAEPVDDALQFAGSALIEEFNYRRVLVGKVPVTEIKRLFDSHGDRLLQRNVRRFLGVRGNRVNEGIASSLEKAEERENFYFYNNGITVICSKFARNALQGGNYNVQIKGLLVINGGQTCRTIQQTIEKVDPDDADFSGAYVLMRVYELAEADEAIVHQITYATNSQNPVDLRDLKANDPRQEALAIAVEQLGYTYKRYRDDVAVTASTITTSVAAESVLAVWRHRPHQARFRRSVHFGVLYDDIFDPQLNAAQLIVATLVFRAVEAKRKSTAWEDGPHYLPYASHFLAMLLGKKLLDSCDIPLNQLSHTTFEETKQVLTDQGEALYTSARESLDQVLRDEFGHDPDEESLQKLSATFRRGDLLEKLNALHGADFHMM